MSGHRSAAYLDTLVRPPPGVLLPKQWPTAIRARSLTSPEATRLQHALREDAREYYFSAALSFVEALRGPPQGLYTWTAVKLYYAVFYALRSILALHGWCVFYIDRPDDVLSCYYIEAIPGATAESGVQSTHKAVLKCFRVRLAHLGLLAPIGHGQEEAPTWLMHLREEANYKNARFYEPDVPPHFEEAARLGVRKAISLYLQPGKEILAFDPDHAIIAFPLAALRCAMREFSACQVVPLGEQDTGTLRHHCADRTGPLDLLLRALAG